MEDQIMDSSLPVAVPVPYKSRRGWLIAFGVVEILIGVAFLLMLSFMMFFLLGPAAARMPPNAMSAGPISRPVLAAMAGLQYGLIAAIFFIAGIGSIRCRNWARIMMLVVSGLWLALGLMTTLFMGFMFPIIMRQRSAKISCETQHTVIVGMITFMAILGIILPAIFLFFYSRKGVKATCLAHNGTAVATFAAAGIPAPSLPIPLAILGVWEAFGAFSMFAVLFMRVTMVFGVVLHGAAAVLVMLSYSVLSGGAAWFIFRQKLIGWKIALFKTGIWTISLIVTCLRNPDLLQMYRQMGLNDQAVRIYEQAPQLLTIIWVGIAVMMTVLLAFILYARSFFPAEERG